MHHREPEQHLDIGKTSYIRRLPSEILEEILTLALTYPEGLCERPTNGHGSDYDNGAVVTQQSDLAWCPMLEYYNMDVGTVLTRWGRATFHNYALQPDLRIASKASLVSVLSVCREWYNTGLEMFYKRNHFHFRSLGHFVHISENFMTRPQRALISEITIMWIFLSSSGHEFLMALKEFDSLRTLRIWLHHPAWLTLKATIDHYADIFHELKNLSSIEILCTENRECAICKEQEEYLQSVVTQSSEAYQRSCLALADFPHD